MVPKEIPLELLWEYRHASDDDQKGKYCASIADDEAIKEQNGDNTTVMTPKEKAKELFDKFYKITGPFTEAKQCALIAVGTAVESIESIDSEMINDNFKEALLIYLEAVKQEIEKL